MTALYPEAQRTAPAARTALATALQTITEGHLPDPYYTADRILRHLYLAPAVPPLRSQHLVLIQALQEHLDRHFGDPVWAADALIDELHADHLEVQPLTQPTLLPWSDR